MVGESILNWIEDTWNNATRRNNAMQDMSKAPDVASLEAIWNTLSADEQSQAGLKQAHESRLKQLRGHDTGLTGPVKTVVLKLLKDWQEETEKYNLTDQSKAEENLASMAEYIINHEVDMFAIELGLGALPNGWGDVASSKVNSISNWLGFGAVVNAVGHDNVKIGLLRPWQDSLEAKYRNRRPGDVALYAAYRTRELTATKATDLEKLDDKLMDQIEAENQTIYDREIAKWGYSEEFAGALARSATRTLTFGNMIALAKQGLLTRGNAIYNLWGYGLDRVVMKPALDALMAQNEMSNYEGFRSMIEPSFTSGDLDEADLVAYYNKIHVPVEIQNWVLPRLRKAREKALAKQAGSTTTKERDLTVSQVQQAYQNNLMDRARAQNMILGLGYNLEEAKILLDLAELRRKLPSAQTLKRLPLSDYEKAYKNKIIGKEHVLARMQGEYTQEDIALERALLEKGVA